MLENQQRKSFWSKPEGFTGTLFLGAIAALIFFFWGSIVPFILLTLTNTIYTIIAACVLVGLVYMLLDKNVRTFIWYLYKVTMKKITSIFIQIDPIAIIKTYISTLIDKQKDMNEQILKLKAEIGKLNVEISNNEKYIEDSLKEANKAKEMSATNPSYINEVTLLTREAGRFKATNDKLYPLKTKMENMYNGLTKMHDSVGYLIRDKQSEIHAKEKEYAAIKASHNAMKGALSFINGDNNEKMIFDEAMEFLQDDMGRKVGEMERFMEMSTGFINGVDIQNGIYEDDAVKMLEAFNKSDFTFLLDNKNDTKELNVISSNNVIVNSHKTTNTSYSNLLD